MSKANKRLRKSIFRKTAVIFVVVALVPLAILGLHGHNYYGQQLDRMVDGGMMTAYEAAREASHMQEQALVYMGYGLLIALVLGYFFASSLVRPIRVLERGARKIGDGNLGHRVSTDTDDELEDLATTINQMAASLESRESEISIRNRDLSILYELAHTMSESRELDDLLNYALGQVMDVAHSESGCVLLTDRDGRLYPRYCEGAGMQDGSCSYMGAFDRAAAMAIDIMEPVTIACDDGTGKQSFDSLAGIPLRLEGKWQGAICLSGRKIDFTRGMLDFLSAIASEISLAIENTHLIERLESQNVELGLATAEIGNLFAEAERNKSFNTRYENQNLVKCWEVKHCDSTECPAYGKMDNLRCWQVAGTHCGGQVQGVFAQKLGNCEKCEVYSTACSDKITLIGETFNNMMAILEQRVKEHEELQRQLYSSSKLAAIGELAAGVAHEINNPLTGILANAMLLKSHPDNIATVEKRIKTIESETLRVRDIVRNLLDFAHPGNHLPQEPVPLEKILEQTLFLVRHQASLASVEIITSCPPDIPPVLVDANQLKQVFMNIIHNAIHAMDGGGTLQIFTRRHNKKGNVEGFVEICFQDTGAGIPPEDMPRIFNPFFTTKRVGEGTGLGLSVSQRIVNEHGGEIVAESEVGVGSTFIVVLPGYRASRAGDTGQDGDGERHVA